MNFLKNSNRNISFQTDDDMFLELLFLMIRGKTIKFASSLKKETNLKEKSLISDVEIMESNENVQYVNTNWLIDKKLSCKHLEKAKSEAKQ